MQAYIRSSSTAASAPTPGTPGAHSLSRSAPSTVDSTFSRRVLARRKSRQVFTAIR